MLNVVANLLEYKMAGRVESLEAEVQNLLTALYESVHIHFPDVEQVAVNKGIEGAMPHQVKGQLGQAFIQKVVSIIDGIYSKRSEMTLGAVLDMAAELVHLIDDNQYVAFNDDGSVSDDDSAEPSRAQFPHVVQFVGLLPGGNQTQRKDMYAKVPKGLHRVFGIGKQIVSVINEIRDMDPDKVLSSFESVNMDVDLGEPPAAMVDLNLKTKFVRQWGPTLFNGASPTLDDVSNLLSNKPELNRPFSTFLNSLNRGGDGGSTKDLIMNEFDNAFGYSAQ